MNRWVTDQEIWHKAATTVRDAERADFATTVTDYSESIDTVCEAINSLKAQMADTAQHEHLRESLVLVRSLKLVPSPSEKVLTYFLQQEPELTYAAPEAKL